MRLTRIALSFLCLALAAAPLRAQEQSTITGVIKDAQGLALPGVTVSVKNLKTGQVRATTSSGDGRFTVTALNPTTYDVSAHIEGFSDAETKGIVTAVGKTSTVNLTLQPAGVAISTTVVGETKPLIQTTESDISTSIPPHLIEALPVAERNTITLALLAPGVAAAPYFDPTKSRDNFDGFSTGATSASSTITLVDGGDNNDDVVGSILQFYPQDSIQEFEVVTSRFKAEFGRNDGGVVNMITKSGGNALSGGGYWLLRDKSLNSKTFLQEANDEEKPEFHQDVAGGYLGGPIVKEKAFFFGNYDYTKRKQELTTTGNGEIPQLDAQGNVPTPFKQKLGLAKVSGNLGQNNQFIGRYGYQSDSTENANLNSTNSIDQGGLLTNKYHSILAKNQTIIGTSKLNELVYQFSSFRNSIVSNAAGSALEDRQLTIASTYSLGQNPNHPQNTDQDKHQIGDHFSWRSQWKGDHDFKAGIELIHEKIGGGFGTLGPFVSFTWDTPDGYNSGANADLASITNGPALFIGKTTDNIWSGYLQDDWHPTQRVTLNLGLRYDVWTNEWTQNKDKGTNGPGRTFISSDPIFFGAQPETDKNNIAPRLGAAYDVEGNGKFVVRGGYGMYFQNVFFNTPLFVPFFEGINQGSLLFGEEAGEPPVTFTPDMPFCAPGGSGPGCIPVPTIPGASAQDFVGSPALTAADPRINTPLTHQFSAGFSTLLPRDFALDIDYVRSFNDSLVYLSRVATRQTVNGLPTSNMHRQALVLTQGGRQTYNGLLISARKNVDKLSMQASYTFARASGTSGRQGAAISDDRDGQLFLDNLGPNPSSRDHLFSASLFYKLPYEFQVGAILRFQSGFHFTPIDRTLRTRQPDGRLTDVDNDGLFGDTIADTRQGSPIGCGHRGCATGDSFSQVDLRFSKSFLLAQRYRPQVFFEVFNIFNTANEKFDAVTTNVRLATYGTSSDIAGQPRQAQFSLRMDF